MWTKFVITICALIFPNAISSPTYSERPRSPLCVKKNTSCAYDGTCEMIYYPLNSSICANLLFKNDKTDLSKLTLGSARLQTYLYTDRIYSQTAFNITFSNVTWTDLKFRIMQNGNADKNTCRQFKRTTNSSVSSISYDCLWSNERYEGKPFIFDYEAQLDSHVESARFVFLVPTVSLSDLKDTWRLLTYVETSRSFIGRSVFNVYWPTLPESFGVDCYKVYLFSNETGEETILDSADVCNCEDSLCKYSTYLWFGSVRFGVQPIYDGSSDNFLSKTQYFNLGGDTALPLLVALVVCSILFPIALYLLLAVSNHLAKRRSMADPPKVLIIHSPTTTPHLHVVEAISHYLNTHCHILAGMDELDIPNSPSKDPFLWCAEAIQSADVVCVVASPFFSQIRSSSALYRTDRLLLRLLREQYASRSKTRYCVLMPPYCTPADVPIEAASLKKLRIPEDLNKVVTLARGRWLPYCLSSLPETASDFSRQGRELTDSLRLAADDLRDNRQLYLTQVEEAKNTEKSQLNKKEDLINLDHKAGKEFSLSPEVFEERKTEYKMMAEDTFAHYPSNLENLNLLGDKGASATGAVVQQHRPTIAAVDLDALDL